MKTIGYALCLLLSGCSQGLQIKYESPKCSVTIVGTEDKETIERATRSLSVKDDCSMTLNFGSKGEQAGDQTAKALDTVLGKLVPFIGGGK